LRFLLHPFLSTLGFHSRPVFLPSHLRPLGWFRSGGVGVGANTDSHPWIMLPEAEMSEVEPSRKVEMSIPA
jgi:hypothetical protein